MRSLAVCCILAVVLWAAAQALRPPAAVNHQIAPPVYVVGVPVATTLPVLIPAGDAPPALSVNGPNPSAAPGSVVAITQEGP